MPETMLQLGPIQFSIKGAAYDELKHKTSYRWVKKPRLLRKPAHQFVGPGDDDITLSGVIHTLLDYSGSGDRVGTGHIDKIREYAAQGEPYTLISGTGRKLGKFVILDVENNDTILFDNGAPRKMGFNISLSLYGEDEPAKDGIIFDSGGGGFMSPRAGGGISTGQSMA